LGPPGYNILPAHMKWLTKDDYRKILYKDQIVGGFILQNYHNTLLLGMIFLAISYQRRGIGTYVLNYLEKNPKYKEIVLNTPEWAIHNQIFFEKKGFIKINTDYDSNLGFTLIYYRKTIKE
jgi:N-acetylglutamate synthase-like GNAT family acetyltransferase